MIRHLDQYDIVQRTKDGYFDANYFLSQWNAVNSNPSRQMIRFLESPKTKEFINEIVNNEKSHSAEMHSGDSQPVIKETQESHIAEMRSSDFQPVIISKGRNTKKGRTPDRVYMHPYLFLDFCMWISPSFKYKVMKFVFDQLIENRHNAGDMYKGLTKSLFNLNCKSEDYVLVARALNHIVFEKHHRDIRQTASQDQLKELTDLQKTLAFNIDTGLIKSFDALIAYLREIYKGKYNPF